MSSRSGWIKVTLCAGAALFWAQPKSWAQPLADRAPISGLVVDETGRAVPSAVLTVRRQEDNGPSAFWGGEARADAGGKFRLPNAQEGRYFLSVEAPGYAPLANFALNWKTGSFPLRLSLSRLTRVELQVSRADGTPLSDSPVWVRLRGPGFDASITRTQTDGQGQAVVPGVAPGTYSFFLAGESGFGAGYDVPVAWQESGTRLDVRLRSGATLKIKASDSAGRNLGGASLILLARSPEEATRLGGRGADPGENWALLGAANAPQALVVRDGDGTLELRGVPEGHFSARLSLPGYDSQSRDIDTLDGQSIEWNAEFPERRAASLSLLLRDASDRPVADALVELRLLPLAADGTFAPSSPFGDEVVPDPNAAPGLPFFVSGPGGRVGRTDANGVLKLFPLKAGRYRVFASRPAPGDWLRSPVAREGAPLDIQVTLDQSNGATVRVP